MIVFRTPKGWTGPKFVDGKPVEGTWRAHQVPIANFKNPEHLKQLEEWMKSYRAHELFDERGKFRDEFAALAPTGHRRMGSNPHANGGELLVPLVESICSCSPAELEKMMSKREPRSVATCLGSASASTRRGTGRGKTLSASRDRAVRCTFSLAGRRADRPPYKDIIPWGPSR